MEKKRSKQASLLLWATVATLLSQNLVIPVISSATFEDQKNYYSPDPNAGSPPTVHHSPPHGSGGGHGSRAPSHGGGNHAGTPPATNCGNPPSGGHYTPSPSPPRGGGGYYSPPSTPSYSSPSNPSYSPPSTPSYSPPSTPSTPTIVSPPSTPIDPGTPTIVSPPTIPGITIPSPPFSFDPNSPPFTCDFWRNHPQLIWGLLGWWGTVGGAFGGITRLSTPTGFGSSMTLQEALENTRTDGLGTLYREGTASLLNSMVNNRFPYTTQQVRDRFVAGLSSQKAAATQAQLFKLANEGRVPRA